MLLAPNPNQDQAGDTAPSGGMYIRQHTLTAGDDSITVDFSDLGLTTAPTLVEGGSIAKSAAGQSNLYASYVDDTKTTTAATFELNAPCDVTGRTLTYMLRL